MPAYVAKTRMRCKTHRKLPAHKGLQRLQNIESSHHPFVVILTVLVLLYHQALMLLGFLLVQQLHGDF
jgi:hypothetical protein